MGEENVYPVNFYSYLTNPVDACFASNADRCVACYYVAMKPNGQKNDVCCEYRVTQKKRAPILIILNTRGPFFFGVTLYTRGAPDPSLLQIPIDI